ncbi:MAG TPA: cytochrome b N-terminal domain-containing protein [Hyphomicrobiales bacterium]|jgi:ubiquinol-cytochrome c reductase cytochrome b subunit
MAHQSTYQPTTGFTRWLDSRLPIVRMAYDNILDFPTPRNLTYMWSFGGILTFCLGVQIVTGIVLAMHYAASATIAFDSIEHLMRNVPYGWLMRYTHAVGASMFFLAVYLHIFRGLYYGSYKAPREILWIIGVLIFLTMMATAFMGYSLVWGQMSFWAVTVITNLFSSLDALVSGLGTTLVQWIWGGFAVNDATLNRLFSLHYLLPFVIAGLVGLHIWALHVVGNNNPVGVDLRDPQKEAVAFHPYYTAKDLFALMVFALVFAYFVFYLPNYLGHPDNYIEANPLQTPPHIVPEWYFLPFYAMLRSITDDLWIIRILPLINGKLGGVITMFGAIVVLCFAPWLDTSRERSSRYRPIYKWFFWVLVVDCLALGYLGSKPPEGGYLIASQLATAYYFIHFLIVLPLVGIFETPRPRPRTVADSIFGTGGGGGGRVPHPVAAAAEKR